MTVFLVYNNKSDNFANYIQTVKQQEAITINENPQQQQQQRNLTVIYFYFRGRQHQGHTEANRLLYSKGKRRHIALQPLPPQEPQLQMRTVQWTVVPPLPGQPYQHQVHQHQQLHPWLRNDHLHRQGPQQSTPFQQVYKDKYVCKGKTLKHQRKDIDIGALPCKAVKIQVKKGTQLCSKNISLIGMDALEIAQKFGDQYFKLLVENPMKILYFK